MAELKSYSKEELLALKAKLEKEYADFDEYGLDAPFAAPQCMTVMEPR